MRTDRDRLLAGLQALGGDARVPDTVDGACARFFATSPPTLSPGPPIFVKWGGDNERRCRLRGVRGGARDECAEARGAGA